MPELGFRGIFKKATDGLLTMQAVGCIGTGLLGN